MKLTNIAGFETIEEFVQWKLDAFSREEKTFEKLFSYMFSDEENIMAESSDGYRVRKVTYGQCRQQILARAAAVKECVSAAPDSIVGIYMDNSLDWIRIFWSVLMCGWRPLLMNLRLPEEVLEGILQQHQVAAVISDGRHFSVPTVLAQDIPMEGQMPCDTWDFGREVLFMSSGTTQNVKLCAYTAENFYYQIANSVEIVKNCPAISRHYEGQLKQLTLLPFYHVFGFIAVYLWFGFFSRTFVFLKNLNPQTIQNTVKKHKVTHIFAVPLVWDAVYKAAIRTAQKQGDKTYRKLCKGIRLANSGSLGRKLTYRRMGQVREKLFGDSVCFMISGGGYISSEALRFFNGIGYHIANGYGMTEVGITSLDISPSAAVRNRGSIGTPFGCTQYRITEDGQLLIRGKNMASRIYQGTEEYVTDFDTWFFSRDLARQESCGYFLQGRQDDLIISATGENLNPQLIEQALHIPDAQALCIFGLHNEPVLLLSSRGCYSPNQVCRLINSARAEISRLGYQNELKRVLVTPDSLMEPGDIKVSRRKLAQRVESGAMTLLEDRGLEEKLAAILEGLEAQIQETFAQTLHKDPREIGPDAHFFSDLGGSSLDYFMLSDAISEKYGLDIKTGDGRSLCTVREICDYIKDK